MQGEGKKSLCQTVRSDLLHLKVGRERLTELVDVLAVLHDKSVQEARAAHLELGGVLLLVLLDADLTGVLPARDDEELLDVSDLLRHVGGKFDGGGLKKNTTKTQTKKNRQQKRKKKKTRLKNKSLVFPFLPFLFSSNLRLIREIRIYELVTS